MVKRIAKKNYKIKFKNGYKGLILKTSSFTRSNFLCKEHKMSDLKSKIPDINEITSMAGKLFKDVKQSISEIISTYKEKHSESDANCSEAKTTGKAKKSTTKKEKDTEAK